VGPDIRGLLLCGGRATRFGSDKLLTEVRIGGLDGPLVTHAARNLIAGIGNALAVLPPGAEPLRGALRAAGCEILESDRTAEGMGASLAAGVEAADSADGWIVALGDMPLIPAAIFHAVREALAGGALIAAVVDRASGQRGHPVGFSAALRAELLALRGDVGARRVLARHSFDLVTVPTDDPAIFFDVDTAEDLARLSAG
jgi:molybdenum cofactor cytidylyltransferase